jgi:hypothetical protein
MIKKKAVLRNQNDENDSRYLEAVLKDNGDIVIEGQDLGKGVEDAFGCSEYEWTWIIKSKNVHLLQSALGGAKDIIKTLKNEYSGDNASKLYKFLQDNKMPIEGYSRIGD